MAGPSVINVENLNLALEAEAAAAEAAIADAVARLNELTPPPLPQEAQASEQVGNLDRRSVIKGVVGAAVLALFPKKLIMPAVQTVGEGAGWAFDQILGAERLLPGRTIVPEPRYDTRPPLEAKPFDGTAEVNTFFGKTKRGQLVMCFGMNTPLVTEHTGAELIKNEVLFERGKAAINAADGDQEWVTLLANQEGTELFAIGKQNVYKYTVGLGRPGQESKGEFERIMVKNPNDDALPSRATAPEAWKTIEAASEESPLMIVHEVRKGNQALDHFGYRVYPSILPSTEMPSMDFPTGPDHCAQTPQEVLENRKRGIFVTHDGSLIDGNHFRAKAREYYDLLNKLKALAIFIPEGSTESIEITVPYSENSPAGYTVKIPRKSLHPDSIDRLAFELMATVSDAMEGITQSYAYETLPGPVADRLPEFGANGPEDRFSNTEAAINAGNKFKDSDLDKQITESFIKLHTENPNLSIEELFSKVSTITMEHRDEFATEVLTDYMVKNGVQRQYSNKVVSMALGLYHRMANKTSEEDGITAPLTRLPTFLAPNPRVDYEVTHIPVGQVMALKALSESAH